MEAKSMNGSTMVGFGITPEGIDQNYIIYEFALEIGWQMKSKNISDWLTHFITSRYGFNSKNISTAWKILSETVYDYNSSEQMRGKYIYNRRPSLRLLPWVLKNNYYSTTYGFKIINFIDMVQLN